MKKKILLSIAIVAVVSIILAGVALRGEIKMAYNMAFGSSQKNQAELDKNKKELEENLVDRYSVDPELARGFTKEEEEKLLKGEISVDEVIKRLDGSKDGSDSLVNSKDNTEKLNSVITEGTRDIYKIKAEYLVKLGALEGEIHKFYVDKVVAGSSKKSAKQAVIASYLPKLYDIVKEADDKMDGRLKKLETDIKALGGDTSIIKKIRTEYENEKKAKQSQYIERMNQNGGY